LLDLPVGTFLEEEEEQEEEVSGPTRSVTKYNGSEMAGSQEPDIMIS